MKASGLFTAVVLAGALFFRLWNIGYDLPFVYNTDELVFTAAPSAHFFAGDFNPHDFRHPGSLFMYLVHLPLRLDYFGSGRPAADYAALAVFAPGGSVFLGRLVSVLAGTFSVWILLGLARRVLSSPAAVLAAGLLALAPMHIRFSRVARTDALALALVLGAVYCAFRFIEAGLGWGCLAAFLAGLGGASKYVALLAVFPAAAALFLRGYRPGWKRLLPLTALLLVPAGLFAGAPYVFLDWRSAWADIVAQESVSLAGYPPLSLFPKAFWYLGEALPFAFGGALVPLAGLAGILLLSRRAWRRWAVVFAFPLAYFALVCWGTVRVPRYVFYLLPFAALLSARALEWAAGIGAKTGRLVFAAGAALLLFQPGQASLQALLDMEKEDVRSVVRAWIERNIPPGQGIVYEASLPPLQQLDLGRYRLWDTSWARVVSRPPAAYRERGYGWLVLSRWQKRIVLDNPGRWPAGAERYREIEENCELAASLSGRGGKTVDVYRLPPAPAARP